MKIVKVPQNDIDMLEITRKDIWTIIDGIENGTIKPHQAANFMIGCTTPLYKLTHRKYKETFLSKLKRVFKWT